MLRDHQSISQPRASSSPPSGILQEALQLLLDEGVFRCEGSPEASSSSSGGESEWALPPSVAASVSVLRAGLDIDCLMVRYQGVDWQDERNWGCNGRQAPQGQFSYDGVTLDPYETVFVPHSPLMVQQQHPAAVSTAKYDLWMHVGAQGASFDRGDGYPWV